MRLQRLRKAGETVVEDWWGELDWETQDWIARHLGEVLPVDVAAKVGAAGGQLRRTRFLGSDGAAYQLRQRDVREILQLHRAA
jgi:hypothetical protein